MSGHVHRAAESARRRTFASDAFVRAAALFRALGDVERLNLLEQIVDGERCVSEIAVTSHANLSTVSQRLRVLRSEGLVVHRKGGKHVYYKLADRHVVDLVRSALEHVSEPRASVVRTARPRRTRKEQ